MQSAFSGADRLCYLSANCKTAGLDVAQKNGHGELEKSNVVDCFYIDAFELGLGNIKVETFDETTGILAIWKGLAGGHGWLFCNHVHT